MLLLERLPIDLVEMVIVKSDSYKLFEKLRIMLPKLNESKRESRIKDKLTKVYHTGYSLEYVLYNMNHREYNKPAVIYHKCDDLFTLTYMYYISNNLRRNDGFVRINGYYRDNGLYHDTDSENSQELLVSMDYNYYKHRLYRIIDRGFKHFDE